MRLTYGIKGHTCGCVSGQFVADLYCPLHEAADWIVDRTRKACGADSRIGWTVQIWRDGEIVYRHTY
jgi:hypothetical protein